MTSPARAPADRPKPPNSAPYRRSSRSSGPLTSSSPAPSTRERHEAAEEAVPESDVQERPADEGVGRAEQFRHLDFLAPVLDVEADRVADDHDHGADQQHRGDPDRAAHDVEYRRQPRQPLGIELHQVDLRARRKLGLDRGELLG